MFSWPECGDSTHQRSSSTHRPSLLISHSPTFTDEIESVCQGLSQSIDTVLRPALSVLRDHYLLDTQDDPGHGVGGGYLNISIRGGHVLFKILIRKGLAPDIILPGDAPGPSLGSELCLRREGDQILYCPSRVLSCLVHQHYLTLQMKSRKH